MRVSKQAVSKGFQTLLQFALAVQDRMDLFTVVKLISERRGWILSNDGFVRQLVHPGLTEALMNLQSFALRSKAKPCARRSLTKAACPIRRTSEASCASATGRRA